MISELFITIAWWDLNIPPFTNSHEITKKETKVSVQRSLDIYKVSEMLEEPE